MPDHVAGAVVEPWLTADLPAEDGLVESSCLRRVLHRDPKGTKYPSF
jgi:hypothetical protein